MFQKILEQIEKYNSIVIFGHDFPDGDCFGSQIGLKESILLTYPEKKVFVVGSGIRRFESIIGKIDDIEDSIIEESLAILVDANDLSRAEDSRIYKAKAWVKFDHHIENGKFTEGPFVVCENANSTCEVILDFIRQMNLKYNKTVCNALYLGILTDSARFQFIDDFIKAFSDASWLCSNGADPKALTKILQMTNEYSIAFKGYVYSHYKKTKNGVIYAYLKADELKKFNLSIYKAVTMVNLISNVVGYPVWAFFCENEQKDCKIEFRSSGPAVQPIATKYGGGGHRNAAGCLLHDFNESKLKKILKDLDELITESNKE